MSEAVYEFRPIDGYEHFLGGFRRYANGLWIEDDGAYDIAFINNGFGAPVHLSVEVPCHKNIVCSWLTTHWRGSVPRHPRGNPWHYALAEGETEWGGPASLRDSHPSIKAARSGADLLCKESRCANGRHVEFHADDPHILAGLVRDRKSKEVFHFPDNLKCMYCGISPEVTQ